MDTAIPNKTQSIAEVPARPEWRSPEIVKIELKRTLFEGGSIIDFGMTGSLTN